jgi:hypothetical protein
MLEAVKSTLAAAPIVQRGLEQSSNARSFAANPDKVQEVAEAPYVSPNVRVDNNAKIAILEFRDSVSGDVLAQIPSEAQLEAYKRREAKQDAELNAELSGANKKIEQAEDRGDEAAAAVARAEAQPSEAQITAKTQIDA